MDGPDADVARSAAMAAMIGMAVDAKAKAVKKKKRKKAKARIRINKSNKFM
jgi:hypothetical protein